MTERRRTRNTTPIWKIDTELVYTIIILIIILCLFGCSSLENLNSEEIVRVTPRR